MITFGAVDRHGLDRVGIRHMFLFSSLVICNLFGRKGPAHIFLQATNGSEALHVAHEPQLGHVCLIISLRCVIITL
jgi:hypothetical protein